MPWIMSDFNIGFLAGLIYLTLGMLATMLVDIKTLRLNFLWEISELLVFLVMLTWVLVLPVLLWLEPIEPRKRGTAE